MNWQKYLQLTKKKIVITIISFFIFVLLHNLFYAIFGFEEPIFFLLAVIGTPIYTIIAIIYTLVKQVK